MLCESIVGMEKRVMKLTYIKILKDDEIRHVGVLGMHWGRHKKNEPIQTVQARKKVVEAKGVLKKAKQDMNYNTGYGMVAASKDVQKKFDSAKDEYRYAKQDLASINVLRKLSSKPKSSAQLAMEEKYKKKGLSEDEAAVAAYQNIRTKKIIAAVGATALVAGGAYAAYKIHDSRIDKIIKSGSTIQNISGDANPGIRDAFYGSNNKLDRIKYRGLYGQQVLASSSDKTAVQKEIKALSDIKQASFKNAKSSFDDLLKNDREFAMNFTKYLNDPITKEKLGGVGPAGVRIENARKSLAAGKFDKNLYETFNTALVDHDASMQKVTDKYFGELSKKGYNAIRDVNDHKYSGYKAFNPIIAFNTTGKVDVVDIKKLTEEEVMKAKDIAYVHIVGSTLAKQGAAVSAVVLANSKFQSTTKKMSTNKKVAAYIRDNPATKKTTTEIARMIERSAV